MASAVGGSASKQTAGTPRGLEHGIEGGVANFGAIREGILRAYDFRNEAVLDNEAPYASPEELQRITQYLNNKGNMTQAQLAELQKQDEEYAKNKEADKKRDPSLTIDVVEQMNSEDPLCGFGYFFLPLNLSHSL